MREIQFKKCKNLQLQFKQKDLELILISKLSNVLFWNTNLI